MNTVEHSVSFTALGTTAVLVVGDPAALDRAREILEDEVAAIDKACSRFLPDSELSVVNATPGRWVPISPQFAAAVDVALRAARLTDGAVDPTVGASMRVLGYDRDVAEVERDGPSVRVTVGRVPGWRLVELDPAGGRIRIPAGVELDLGATAKAWCADLAARRAADATGAGVLVSLGGDVAVSGPPPAGGWTIRVTDDHAAPAEAPGQTVAVTGGGLATSSTTVRAWDRGDARLHHVVDPSTGSPAAVWWRTVSVAAGSCVDANTASTAAVVLGREAPGWLERHGLPARLVAADGSVTVVGGWPVDGDAVGAAGADVAARDTASAEVREVASCSR